MQLLVIDGNSILNRAYYGIRLLSSKDGQFTNAIVGFLNILQKLRDVTQPDGIVVAFDVHAPTFRHQMYTEYKAGRHATPPELLSQFEPTKQILRYMGICVLEKEGYEADDILGTLAKACTDQGHFCTLATGDRDALQLVNDQVHVLLAATKAGQPETVCYDPQTVLERYRLTPAQLIDLKALMGDSSDNIPGVAGIGEKTATELLLKSGSVDALYEQLDTLDVRASVKAKLMDGKQSAMLSRTLGTICCTAPISTDIEGYRLSAVQEQPLAQLLAKLELFKWIEKLGLLSATADIPAQATELPAAPEAKDLDSAAAAAFSNGGKMYFLLQEQKVWLFDGENGLFTAPQEDENWIKLLQDASIDKYTYDCKAAYRFVICKGIKLNGLKMDALLAAYLLNPLASGYALSRLFAEYAVPCADTQQNQAMVAAMPALCQVLQEQLQQQGQWNLLLQVEQPLAKVLAYMEHEGIGVDAKGIEEFGISLESSITALQEQIWQTVGYSFNLNSPKQLGVALFEDLALPGGKKGKSGYSTNADVLEKLRGEYPVVEQLLEYRTLTKLKSTYCDGLVKQVAADGRIHTSFNQTETRTGRISSTEPNLQNIPVRKPLGREMRRFFRAREGWVLCDADYSQIELRVLAHMAQDATMIEAFRTGADIHTITASQVFNVPQSMVTPLMRSHAKAVNFGIIYGIGPHSLAEDIKVSYREAKQYIEGYLYHYQSVAGFMDGLIATAKQCGYAQTLFGRRRPLPELTASNAVMRGFGERVARNMPIQGTAADIIKIAMIRVFERLEKEGMQARLLLQIHDELIVEAPEHEAERVAALLQQEMQAAVELSVVLETDVHIGKTWFDAKQ